MRWMSRSLIACFHAYSAVKPLERKSNYSATSNNMKLIHWPGAGTIPTRTIPTATIPTSVIIVGLLSAYWRSPAPRSTCGTGRVRVRVRVSDTGACRNGECRNGACRNSACRNGDLYPLMGGLLHLVQRGGAWADCDPAQSTPRCTK